MDKSGLNTQAGTLKNCRHAIKNLQKQHQELDNYIKQVWKGISANEFLKNYGQYESSNLYKEVLSKLDASIEAMVELNKTYDKFVRDSKLEAEREYLNIQQQRRYSSGV